MWHYLPPLWTWELAQLLTQWGVCLSKLCAVSFTWSRLFHTSSSSLTMCETFLGPICGLITLCNHTVMCLCLKYSKKDSYSGYCDAFPSSLFLRGPWAGTQTFSQGDVSNTIEHLGKGRSHPLPSNIDITSMKQIWPLNR